MQILFKVTLLIFRSSATHAKEKFLNCNFIQIATKGKMFKMLQSNGVATCLSIKRNGNKIHEIGEGV